jgi:hypothetical protein
MTARPDDRAERERRGRAKVLAIGVLGAAALGWLALRALPERGAEPTGETAALASGGVEAAVREQVPSVPLSVVAERLGSCASSSGPDCSGVVYFWTTEMPLSEQGIDEIRAAAARLGVTLDVVRSTELYPAQGKVPEGVASLAAELVRAGASLHAPSFIVHRGGALDRSAILGYKTADAYATLIEARLQGGAAASLSATPEDGSGAGEPGDASAAGEGTPAPAAAAPLTWKDFPLAGQPGAYFRWVPGRDVVAYEAGGRVYLLDLENGQNGTAPGFIDFVPTPDGSLFVTPGRRALEFYDAEQVFRASRAGRGREVAPVYSDPEMRDQYPSVGILSSSTQEGTTRTVYRVMTSWFDKVVFRDYEVRSGGGTSIVEPLADPVVACGALAFSIPIMAPSGREVAGRDEASAATKVFRLADDGGCQEATDVGLPTGKVAWNADNRRLAFAIPEGAVSDGSGVLFRGRGGTENAGIFVFDRRDGSRVRIEGSMDARRLAFPEFVGSDQVLFLIPPESPGNPPRFRLVCCLR